MHGICVHKCYLRCFRLPGEFTISQRDLPIHLPKEVMLCFVELAEIEWLRVVHCGKNIADGIAVVYSHFRAPARTLESIDVAWSFALQLTTSDRSLVNRQVAVVLIERFGVDCLLKIRDTLDYRCKLSQIFWQPKV